MICMLITYGSFAIVTIAAILLMVSLFKCSEACFDEMCGYFQYLLDDFGEEKMSPEDQLKAIYKIRPIYFSGMRLHTACIKYSIL